MAKLNILLLGGVGFVGRNFVVHAVNADIVGKMRVVDKALPATAYLTAEQKAAFEKVEFKQGNLVNPSTIPREPDDGRGKGKVF